MGLVTAAVGIGKAVAGSALVKTAGSAILKGAAGAAGTHLAGKALGGASGAVGSQGRAISRQSDIVLDQYDFYKNYYRPLEERVIRESEGGIDPGYMADRAGQDVTQRFDLARQSLGRTMDRLGVDVSSGRFRAQLADMQIAQAAAEAGAMTKARGGTLRENAARRYDVASLGRGIPSQSQAALQGISSQYGGQAQLYGQAAGDFANLATQAFGGMKGLFNKPQSKSNTGSTGGYGVGPITLGGGGGGGGGKGPAPGSGFKSSFFDD